MSVTTIQQYTKELLQELNDIYADNEIREFAKIMLEHVLKVSRTQLLMMSNDHLSANQISELRAMSDKLKKQIPIQYIIGKTEFYDLSFEVNKSVLIPRPETEELVDWILKDHKHQPQKIVDIGTGSGCIAISLKANMPNTEVYAWDISTDALSVAKKNAEINNVSITFQEVDVLNHQPQINELDCIVSNPPYVRELEKELMEDNVLNHEPHTALFVSNNDPLIFYRTIAKLGIEMLKTDGLLYFEINEYLSPEMTDMLTEMGYFSIECRKDINGKDRMMKAHKK